MGNSELRWWLRESPRGEVELEVCLWIGGFEDLSGKEKRSVL
jgi:hypothetical protein